MAMDQGSPILSPRQHHTPGATAGPRAAEERGISLSSRAHGVEEGQACRRTTRACSENSNNGANPWAPQTASEWPQEEASRGKVSSQRHPDFVRTPDEANHGDEP